jgi:hypothetical protein
MCKCNVGQRSASKMFPPNWTKPRQLRRKVLRKQIQVFQVRSLLFPFVLFFNFRKYIIGKGRVTRQLNF